MPEIRAEKALVVFRVVYAGAEDVEKLAALQRLRDGLPPASVEPLCVLRTGDDRVVWFRHRLEGAKAYARFDVAVDACAVPGRAAGAAAPRLVLGSADAVVFLAGASAVAADAELDRVVAMLEASGRSPRAFPLWVQTRAGAPDAWARRERRGWRPVVRGEPHDVVELFAACVRDLLAHASGDRRSGTSHAEPARHFAMADAPRPERERGGEWESSRVLTTRTAREIQRLEPPPRSARRRAAWMAAVALVLLATLAAWWVSRRI